MSCLYVLLICLYERRVADRMCFLPNSRTVVAEYVTLRRLLLTPPCILLCLLDYMTASVCLRSSVLHSLYLSIFASHSIYLSLPLTLSIYLCLSLPPPHSPLSLCAQGSAYYGRHRPSPAITHLLYDATSGRSLSLLACLLACLLVSPHKTCSRPLYLSCILLPSPSQHLRTHAHYLPHLCVRAL